MDEIDTEEFFWSIIDVMMKGQDFYSIILHFLYDDAAAKDSVHKGILCRHFEVERMAFLIL